MGLTPYDYIDRLHARHFHLWDEAMEAKHHGIGKPWTREDFDSVTKDFDVSVQQYEHHQDLVLKPGSASSMSHAVSLQRNSVRHTRQQKSFSIRETPTNG